MWKLRQANHNAIFDMMENSIFPVMLPKMLSDEERTSSMVRKSSALVCKYNALTDYTDAFVSDACRAMPTPEDALKASDAWVKFQEVVRGKLNEYPVVSVLFSQRL